ncbi:hypothetical protein PCASD_08839 [Puccinia coronata f. sp. avenae]|uniref:Tet-like 2OG-Fe(II) oxygenase domain-containing protein n=1 Tax=Puccinia coronata f. sp. avenae TaxID=200324 RepID=A0A2N5URW6_9BASI|nr:hypothetical protein PCASD_08839 [Puccinia coronata f. sp. avenae]
MGIEPMPKRLPCHNGCINNQPAALILHGSSSIALILQPVTNLQPVTHTLTTRFQPVAPAPALLHRPHPCIACLLESLAGLYWSPAGIARTDPARRLVSVTHWTLAQSHRPTPFSLARSHSRTCLHSLALSHSLALACTLALACRLPGSHSLAGSQACTLVRLHARSLACTCLLARLHLLSRTCSQAGRLVRLYARTLARLYARTHARSLARSLALACSHARTRLLAPPRLALACRLAGSRACTLALLHSLARTSQARPRSQARTLVRSQARRLARLYARTLARSYACRHACTLALARLQPCPSSLGRLDPLAQRLAPPCANACQALETWAYAMITIVMNPCSRYKASKKNFNKKRGGKHIAATIASVTNLPQTSGTGVFDLPCTRLDLFPDITKDYCQRKKQLKLAKEKYKKYGGPKPSEETIVKRQPTLAEINAAYSIIKNPDLFYLFERGRVRVFDKKLNPDKTKSIIADIVFTNLKTISQQMRDDLDFFLAFLNTSKKFVNKVGSEGRSCGGSMWAIGWRKSMSGLEIVGQYVDTDAIDSNMEEWRQHIQDSERAGKIIWDLFYPIGNVALETNQQFMIEHNLPAFCDGHIPDTDSDNPRAKNFFSSNLTFTSEGFSNHPHKDSRDNDRLPFAFLMCLPTWKEDGRLAFESKGYNVKEGHFVFPEYQFGITFKPDTMVQMIFSQ